MTAVKAHQAEQFLRTLDSKYKAILVFGTDAGLISERARAAAQRLASGGGEVLRIEDGDLETDADRLIVELQTLPMFGGPKVIHTRASRRVTTNVLKPILEQQMLVASLVVEAGSLTPSDAMRALFEKSPVAAAIACYADEGRDLDSLVRDTLKEAGLTISTAAQQALVSRLGADRALSRGELDKLVLYARGKTEIDIEDVDAIVGDASELAIEKVILAAASGRPDVAVEEYDRVIAAGESPQVVILFLQRYFQRLHRLRTALESGKSLDDALRLLRPPIHFKTRPLIEAHCRAWTSASLRDALSKISETAKAARLNSALEATLAGQLALDLAAGAAKSRSPGR